MDSSLLLPLQQQPHQRQGRTFSSWENLDRFIPNRSAMDFDYAHYMLTQQCSKKAKENEAPLMLSPSKEAYQKHLAETFNMNRTRILAFKNKPSPAPTTAEYQSSKPKKPIRSYIPKTADKALNAPDILDDYNLNLLDWSSTNFISMALGNSVYLWDASDGALSELVEADGDDDREENVGPVTSVNWAPDGRRIAVGFNNSDVQVWDVTAHRLVATLKGGSRHWHQCRVGSLDWKNDQMLTTGGMDGKITNNDIRVRAHVVQTYRGHHQEVCGLKWSASGQQLASGGDDNLLHIWDYRSMASASSAHRQWLHRLKDHRATVKALAWCPFQSNLLASGGADRCIKFWNSHTGEGLNSVDTGSQVCALLWNKNERELLSSHGFAQNQLTLWKYPSMVKRAELTGHTSRVLFMVQSPNGCTVATAAGDETIRFWNVFGTPQVAKSASKRNTEPFANLSCIR